MAIAMDIYEKIRYYHEHTEPSQRNVAKILGVSRNTVKKHWERETVPWKCKPGSGSALGMNACKAGFRVKFYTAVNLAAELAEAVQMNRLPRLEKSLSKIDLLIIDELSYLTFNRYQSEMLFQIISERFERASVIISTNLEFSE